MCLFYDYQNSDFLFVDIDEERTMDFLGTGEDI